MRQHKGEKIGKNCFGIHSHTKAITVWKHNLCASVLQPGQLKNLLHSACMFAMMYVMQNIMYSQNSHESV